MRLLWLTVRLLVEHEGAAGPGRAGRTGCSQGCATGRTRTSTTPLFGYWLAAKEGQIVVR